MNERPNLLTASSVDLAILLLPMIGPIEAERMMLAHSVPLAVVERVLTRPLERRAIHVAVAVEAPPYFGQAQPPNDC